MDQVSFVHMADGTKEEYEFLGPIFEEHAQSEIVDNLITLLQVMRGPKLGYQIDRYQHSLQSGTRALRNEESIDMVVGALLHDVADSFAPANHSAAAASVLKPYIDEETHWVIQHHGLFQGYYYYHHLGGDRNARDIFGDHEHYEACVKFCEQYDQNCFDPDYPTLPIEDFRPMLDEVFARESRVPGIPVSAPDGSVAFN